VKIGSKAVNCGRTTFYTGQNPIHFADFLHPVPLFRLAAPLNRHRPLADSGQVITCIPLWVRLVVAWMLALALTANAADSQVTVLAIEDLTQPVPLSRQLLVAEDPARSLRVEDLQRLSEGPQLQRNTDELLFHADTGKRYWFKTSLTLSDAANAQQPMLVFPLFESQIYQLNLWIQDSEGNTRQIEAGYLRRYSAEHSQHGYYAFALPDTPGPLTILGYVDHQGLGLPVSLPVSVMSAAQLTELQQHRFGVMTAFYSVMTMILLYNLFLWASIRQSLYGRYVVFLILGTGVNSMLDGSFQRWFFIDSPSADLIAGQTLVVLMVMAYLAFVKRALGDFGFSRAALQIYRGMMALGTALCLYFLLGGLTPYLSALSNLYVVIGMVYLLVVFLQALRRRIPLAGYFLLSELMPIIGGLIFLLQVHGVLPIQQWLLWSSHAGFVVESLLLSLAVAAQTKMAYQEKEREQLQNRAKTQFFATMSHEFRTPLTAVLGYTELALTPDISPEKRLEYIRTIATSADYMLHLINDTLDMSKIEAQKMDFEKSEFALPAFCAEIHDYASILASKKHLRFHIDYVFPLPAHLVSDRTRLKQVLINLCSNAIKFTETGSVYIQVSANATHNQIRFAVIDTGIGIRPEHLPMLFGAFAQTHDPTAFTVTGSGLGLYLSQLIAQNLGGDIAVASEFGKGSIFTLSVDIGHRMQDLWVNKFEATAHTATPLPVRAADPITDETTPLPERLVLIVDDNSINIKLLSAMIARWGARVITASDGLSAIASIIQHKPALVLMDVDMPVMDGLTAMQHIRALGLKVPAYAITGSVSDTMIRQCQAHGFDGHLAKPFQPHLIEAIVRRHASATRN
jgi:signal transduction histidine kinase/CheY-like chemotaxis protein